jgi:hypothetical protein
MEMNTKLPKCIYSEILLEPPVLSEMDIQIAQQYLPLLAQHYHQCLMMNDGAKDYLFQQYGLYEELMKAFQLGYSSKTLALELPNSESQSGVNLQSSQKRLEVYKGTGHEAFRGCVIVPITSGGKLSGFYAEKALLTRSNSKPQYWAPISSPCIFNADGCSESNVMYMFNSPLTAIQMYEAFGGHVIATEQSYQLSDFDCEFLVETGVKEIVICQDRLVSPQRMSFLSKQLNLYGIQYHSFKLGGEKTYGTA